MWAEKWNQLIRPKGQGWGIMVSDVIEEHGRCLWLSNKEYDRAEDSHPGLWKEARQLLKLGAEYEGYWDSKKFLNQV